MKSSTELLFRINALLNCLGGITFHRKSGLDCEARDMLLAVARAEQEGVPLKISDVRYNESYGSPVTSLKRLQKLIDNGLIKADVDQADQRIQRLTIPQKGRRQIERIASQVRSSVQAC